MYRTTLFLTLAIASASTAAGTACYKPDEIVGARYLISSSDDADKEREITILRQTPSRLIYLSPDDHLTQVYERYSETLVKLIEYFDVESIGVEHDPAPTHPSNDWLSMYQIFPASSLNELKAIGESEVHCLTAVEYAGKNSDGAHVVVTYLPQIDLPASIRRGTGNATKTWSLDQLVTSRMEIDQTLARINTYTLYDFADLGDNEQEDFFRKSRYLQYKLGHKH